MTTIENLARLESEQAITIGLHRRAANDYWANTSKMGAITNIGVLIILGLAIYLLIFVSWKVALLCLVAMFVYVWVIERIGLTVVRIRLLGDEQLFEALYSSGLATVRINATGQTFRYPDEWRPVVESLSRGEVSSA